MRKPLIIHPLLFAVFPILFFFAHNIALVSLGTLLIPLAITISFALLLWCLVSAVVKNREKAGLLVSLFLLLCFSYGHFANAMGDFCLRVGKIMIGPDKVLFPVSCLVFALGAYVTARTPRRLHSLTAALNVAAACLVVVSFTKIVAYELTAKRIGRQYTQITESQPVRMAGREEKAVLRDIYYIILDQYASSRTLAEFYGFDNSEFIDYLTNKGFYIASGSRANYPKTFESLASSLNMKHLLYLTEEVGENCSDQTVVFNMLQDHTVGRFLESQGYSYIHTGSWYEATRRNRFADVNLFYDRYFGLDELSMKLLQTTIIYPILTVIFRGSALSPRDAQREQTLYQFEKIAEIPNIAAPTFVFAHLFIPHGPYVFGPNGEMLTEEQVKKRNAKENYVNQLIFANKKIMVLISQLLSKSDPRPIIILQSDEGPYAGLSQFTDMRPSEIDWTQLSQRDLNVHMRILNAYYLPGIEKNVLYPSITPVNSFRLIFNLYFGTDYPLLKDNSYIFEDLNHPYKFTNVTDKITAD